MDHQVRWMRYQLAKRGLALRVSTKRERNSNPSFGPYVILEDNVVKFSGTIEELAQQMDAYEKANPDYFIKGILRQADAILKHYGAA
jgi:hypothetical protein